MGTVTNLNTTNNQNSAYPVSSPLRKWKQEHQALEGLSLDINSVWTNRKREKPLLQEQGDPCYVYNLVRRIIRVSMEMNKIVAGLPDYEA